MDLKVSISERSELFWSGLNCPNLSAIVISKIFIAFLYPASLKNDLTFFSVFSCLVISISSGV